MRDYNPQLRLLLVSRVEHIKRYLRVNITVYIPIFAVTQLLSDLFYPMAAFYLGVYQPRQIKVFSF